MATTLTGTEKQVAWATDLREKVVQQWEARVKDAERRAADAPELRGDPLEVEWLTVDRPAHEAWLTANVFTQTAAKWWIDNRSTNWLQRAQAALRDQLRAARAEFRKIK